LTENDHLQHVNFSFLVSTGWSWKTRDWRPGVGSL